MLTAGKLEELQEEIDAARRRLLEIQRILETEDRFGEGSRRRWSRGQRRRNRRPEH